MMYGFIKEGTSGSKGNGSTGKGLAVQVRGPECRPPEPDVDAGQIRWPTYNLSTWEVKAAVPGRCGGGSNERSCLHIYGERHLASSSSLRKNILGSVPHVSTHVQTHVRTHTCIPHT